MSKLQSIRENAGMTRTQAAALLGDECNKSISYSTLYMWERKKTIPPLDVVLSMSTIYNIDLPELVNAILE